MTTNLYGEPIIDPAEFEGEHYAAMVPSTAGLPPVCSCDQWQRWRNTSKGQQAHDRARAALVAADSVDPLRQLL